MLETPIIVVLIIAAIVAVLWFQIGAPSSRRFPPPWSAELQQNYYVVRDADGQAERCLFKLLPQKADFPPPLRY